MWQKQAQDVYLDQTWGSQWDNADWRSWSLSNKLCQVKSEKGRPDKDQGSERGQLGFGQATVSQGKG